MEIPSYFADFLHNISPSPGERGEYQRRHQELRERLLAQSDLQDLIVTTFLQGSYRRATLLRPGPGEHADVDVVVVTRMSKEDTTPEQAMRTFGPFLERYYRGKYVLQGRSIGITLDHVDLDLVVTSAPSESQLGILQSTAVRDFQSLEEARIWSWERTLGGHSEDVGKIWLKTAEEDEWKLEPLEIPDREAQAWERTHPLEQIRWTHGKNSTTNGHFTHVVRAIKEWKRVNNLLPKYPKGYPLEHIIGWCCPDGVTSAAEGVTRTLETVRAAFSSYAAVGTVPFLPDHGVPEHDVLRRVSGEDFRAFYSQVCEAAEIARQALVADSVEKSAGLWGKLFGDAFPNPPSGDNGGNSGGGGRGTDPEGRGYTPRETPSVVGGGRFAFGGGRVV